MEIISTIEQRAISETMATNLEETYSDLFTMVESTDLNLYIQAFNSTQVEKLQHLILTRIKDLLAFKKAMMTPDFVQNVYTNYFNNCYGKATRRINRVYIELMARMFVLFCKDFMLTGSQLAAIGGLISPGDMIKPEYDFNHISFVVDYYSEVMEYLKMLGSEKQRDSPLRSLKESFYNQFLTKVLEHQIIVIEFLIFTLNKGETKEDNVVAVFTKALDTYIYILTSQVEIQNKDDINADEMFEINQSCTSFTMPIKTYKNNEAWVKVINPHFIEGLMNLIHREHIVDLTVYPDFLIAVLKVYVIAAGANLNYFASANDRDHFIVLLLKHLTLIVTSDVIYTKVEGLPTKFSLYQLVSLALLKCFLFGSFDKIAYYTDNYTDLLASVTKKYLEASKDSMKEMDDFDLKNLLYYLTHVQAIEKNFERRLFGEDLKELFFKVINRLLSNISDHINSQKDFNTIYDELELLLSALSFNITTVTTHDLITLVAELVSTNDIHQIGLFMMIVGKVTNDIVNLENMQLPSSQFFVEATKKFMELTAKLTTCKEISSKAEGFVFFLANKTMFALFKKLYKTTGFNRDIVIGALELNTGEATDFLLTYLQVVNQTISLGLNRYDELVRVALSNFNVVFRSSSMNKYSNTVQVGKVETSTAIIQNSQILMNSHLSDCNLSILGQHPGVISMYYELITRIYCQYLIANFESNELIDKFSQYLTAIKNIPPANFDYLCKVINGVLEGIQGSWFNEILYQEIISHFINAIASGQINVNNKVLKLMVNLTYKRFIEKLSPEKKEQLRTLYPTFLPIIATQVKQKIIEVDFSKDLNTVNKFFVVPLKRFLQIMGNFFDNFKPSYDDLVLLWSSFDQAFLTKLDTSIVQIYVNELKEIFFFISHYVVRDQSVIMITKNTANYLNLLYVIYIGMETSHTSSYINTLDFTIKNIQHHVTSDNIQFLISIYVDTGLLVKMAKIAINDLCSRHLGQEYLLVNFLYSLWIVDNNVFNTLMNEMSWAKKQLELLHEYVMKLNANHRTLKLKKDEVAAILDIFLNSIN